jgi:Asp-tRNA(Asn)/Glu-tRNA(Gln) amidotransferase A subunit family amidase
LPELHDCTATELRALLKAGATTPTEIVEALLARILDREPSVRSWQFIEPLLALSEARNCHPEGKPLGGIPIGVKDSFDTADMPTSYGSRIYASHRPDQDSGGVASLRSAGSIVMGKTVMTEFAAVFEPAKTVNPYDSSRTPGGSSSGSAAAVADRMVPIAIGTQTAGSVIRPAAYCGVLGYKPSFGAFSTAGLKVICPSLDTVGIFARSVDDLILTAGVLMTDNSDGRFWTPPYGHPRAVDGGAPPLKIAYCRTPHWSDARPAARDAMQVAAEILSKEAAQIEDVDLGSSFENLVPASQTIFLYELAKALSPEHTEFRQLLSAELSALIETGMEINSVDYERARQVTEQARPMVVDVLAKFDLILTPAAVDEAPPFANTGDPLFCRTWTLLGNPALTLPVMLGPTGLPVGVQLVGKAGGDSALLAAARWASARMPALPPPSAVQRIVNATAIGAVPFGSATPSSATAQ